MNELMEIQEKLNMVVQLCKANMKLSKNMVEYISNSSMNTDKKIESVGRKVDELKDLAKKADKRKVPEIHVYTDEELYKLKKTMSWKQLNQKTGIPLSTLQYRHKRYVKETMDFEYEEDDIEV